MFRFLKEFSVSTNAVALLAMSDGKSLFQFVVCYSAGFCESYGIGSAC